MCVTDLHAQISAQSQSVARYLIIRLPREFREFVGSKAEIYQTTPSLAYLDY